MSDKLEAALGYRERDWSVIPIKAGAKTPLERWKQFQSERATEEQIRGWFGNGNDYEVAIVLGRVSGDLAVADFDEEGAYQEWAEQNRELADRLPTAQTGRGYHVYFRCRGCRTGKFKGGDLKAEGGYVLAPPSRHENGSTYTWVNELNGEIPEFPNPGALGVVVGDSEEADRRGERADQTLTEETEAPHIASVSSVKLLLESISADPGRLFASVGEAVRATVPTRGGCRNGAVFQFCRRLRGLPELRDVAVESLEPLARQWHEAAYPNIRTKEFFETWANFVVGWDRVKQPYGKRLEDIRDCAGARSEAGLPRGVLALGPKGRLLAKCCLVLSQESREGRLAGTAPNSETASSS